MSFVAATEPRLYCVPSQTLPKGQEGHHPDGAPPGPWSVSEAYRYCERLANAHYENFPVASRFVPAHLRQHVVAIYAFARTADDFADEPAYAGRRRQCLDAWESMLLDCYHQEVDHPIFTALRDTVRRRCVPVGPLQALLTAFRMDLHKLEYASFGELLGYCRYSANPVGQLVLYVHGHEDPALHRFSDEICTGLQVANFLQDLSVDLPRGRCYLPAEDLLHFGVSIEQLKEGTVDASFRELMRFCVARTRCMFLRGQPLMRKVSPGLSMELDATWRGGMRILDRIEDVNYDVLSHRPRLDKMDIADIAVRSLFSFGRRFVRGEA